MGMIVTRRIGGSSAAAIDAVLATKTELELAGIPLSAAFTYNVDGTVNTVTKGAIVKSLTYNGDGSVNTASDGTYLKTFAYNGDGTVSNITVSNI